MANTFTAPTWVKAKPHASAEVQVGDSDPSARADVINRAEKGLWANIQRVVNTLLDGVTVSAADQATVTALGGTPLRPKYALGSFTVPASIGNFAVTGVGFKPRLVIFLTGYTASGTGQVAVGLAVSSTNRRVMAIYSHPVNQNESSFLTNACIQVLSAGPVNQVVADFVSMDADGFTVNFSVVNISFSVAWAVIE